MKKAVLVVVMLTALFVPLFADTVMVSLKSTAETPLKEFPGLLSEAYALEDGVMNEFFDMGHIVFNAGITSADPPEPPFPAEPPQVRLAKSGGATFLLELHLQYAESVDGEDARVTSVAYRFSNVITGRTLAEGDVSADSVDPENKSDEEIGFELGKILAGIALSTI